MSVSLNSDVGRTPARILLQMDALERGAVAPVLSTRALLRELRKRDPSDGDSFLVERERTIRFSTPFHPHISYVFSVVEPETPSEMAAALRAPDCRVDVRRAQPLDAAGTEQVLASLKHVWSYAQDLYANLESYQAGDPFAPKAVLLTGTRSCGQEDLLRVMAQTVEGALSLTGSSLILSASDSRSESSSPPVVLIDGLEIFSAFKEVLVEETRRGWQRVEGWRGAASFVVAAWYDDGASGSKSVPLEVEQKFDRIVRFALPDLEQRCAFLEAKGWSPHRARARAAATQGSDFRALERLLESEAGEEEEEEKQARANWSEVVGYDEVKSQLDQLVRWRWERAPELARMGVAPSGILLHGPSGCGKSHIVRALARDTGVNFIEVKGSDIFSKWFGDSEKALKEVFVRARASAPCLLFLDRVEMLAPSRAGAGEEGGSSSVGARVLSTLLNELDGIDTASDGGGLVVVGATDRLDLVDDAAKRSGRLGALVDVGYPSRADRAALLRFFLRKAPVDPSMDFDALVQRISAEAHEEEISCARLQTACERAVARVLRSGAAAVGPEHFAP